MTPLLVGAGALLAVHVAITQDGYGGDFDGDDDEEEEMGNLTDVPFSEEIWWCKDAEEYENYKLWEAAVDKQEVAHETACVHYPL